MHRTILGLTGLTVALIAGLTLVASAAPSAAPSALAAGHPLPVKTQSGVNYDTPDPGVLLYNRTFYGFSTRNKKVDLDSVRRYSVPLKG